MRLKDVLKEGALPKVESIAEEIFRREHDVQANDFAGGRFHLNDNFAIGEKSLVLVFNMYEIAAGAMGATTIETPYSQIRTLLKIASEPRP